MVGIVDADLGLNNGGDPRAAERTFQLLHQVSGRAGALEEGRGYGFPQDAPAQPIPVMRALIAGDREAFYASEIAARENAGYPPFGRLASLVISAGDKPSAEGYARRLASTAPQAEALRVLGPAEAPLALVRGRYRFRLLVKSPRALRSVGLSARMARRGAEAEGRRAAGSGYRSDELLVSFRRAGRTKLSESEKTYCRFPHSSRSWPKILQIVPSSPGKSAEENLHAPELESGTESAVL